MEKRRKPWNILMCQHKEQFSATDNFKCDSNELECYECEGCGFETTLKVTLNNHSCVFLEKVGNNVNIRAPLKSYKCNKCDFRTCSVLVLTGHVRNCNGTRMKRRVNIRNLHTCYYKSRSNFLMDNYVRQQPASEAFKCGSYAPGYYKCGSCDFETDLKVNLQRHINVDHGGEVNPAFENILNCYKCKNCNFETFSLLVLLKHMNNLNHKKSSHTRKNKWLKNNRKLKYKHCAYAGKEKVCEVWLSCGQCTFKTRWRSCLYIHIKRKHVDEKDIKWFKCNECTFKTKEKEYLKSHVFRKHDSSENINWLKCDQCSFKTKIKNDLGKHVYYSHNTNETFKCDYCSFRTKRKYYLKRHIKCKHTNEKDIDWLKCDQCMFKTKTRNYLNKHIKRKHLNDEDVSWAKCNMCTFKCKEKGYLKQHIVLKHTALENIEWFYCDRCTFKAKLKNLLNKHIIKKHSSEEINWFKCEEYT